MSASEIGHSHVSYEVDDYAAFIRIERPERRNALAEATFAQLAQLFIRAGEDPQVRAVVLTGAGEKAFCAGADLKEAAEIIRDAAAVPQPMQGFQRNLFEVVLETYKPTIAAINGSAIGAGFELALCCDLRVAVSDARLGLPEATLGLGANLGSTLLPRLIPRAIAMEMLYTGRLIDAHEGLRIGLLNEVAERERFPDAVRRLVAQVTANAPLSLRRYKEMAIKGWELPIPVALRLNVGPNPYGSADAIEGIRAHAEKRPAQWQGT
jgi:enoyl-CoA hydratase